MSDRLREYEIIALQYPELVVLAVDNRKSGSGCTDAYSTAVATYRNLNQLLLRSIIVMAHYAR